MYHSSCRKEYVSPSDTNRYKEAPKLSLSHILTVKCYIMDWCKVRPTHTP